MTNRERPMTESELDRLLGTWLTEGADVAPDRIAENAMLEVATTPQERDWTRALRTSFAQAPLAWASVILALAVGIGLLVGIRLVGGPAPNPSPSVDPNALVLQSYEDAGYEMLIPASWTEVDSGYADAQTWSGPAGTLMISYGTSIFEGGEVTICAPPLPDYNTCMTTDYGYSVPVVPSDYTGPISQEGWLDRCDGGCPVTYTETTLDGEPAGQDRAVIAPVDPETGQDLQDLQLTYVSTFHNYRPIILYWTEPLATADLVRVEAMRESFRFLDASAGGSPPPFVDPTELILYSNPDDGYEMLMPRFWQESAAALNDPNGDPYPGVQTFGEDGASNGTPALTISVGSPDGSVFADCIGPLQEGPSLPPPECRQFTATTLDELQAALTTIPPYYTGAPGLPTEESGDLVLGGEAGRFERPVYLTDSHGCLGCPWILSHAFTIHGGGPQVLAFDWWNIDFERISADYMDQMLASFRFLD
jgi:hypothetical protein